MRSKQQDTILEPRIPKEPTGRPLPLRNKINYKVQKYIIASSNRGNVISRSIATSTAKALTSCNPGYVGQINLESSPCAQRLFRWMGFVRRRGTTTKLEISDGAFKEAQLLITNDIVSKVDKWWTSQIPWSSTSRKRTPKLSRSKAALTKGALLILSLLPLVETFTDASHLRRKNHKIFAQIQIPQLIFVKCQQDPLEQQKRSMQINRRNLSVIHWKSLSRGESPRQPKSTCYHECLFRPNNISCFRLLQR